MPLKIDMESYQRRGQHVIGMIYVRVDGKTVFTNGVNLSTAKGRADFIAAAGARLNGARPTDADFEAQLLEMLERAEAQLAKERTPNRPAEADDEERIGDYAIRAGRYERISIKETSLGPVEVRQPLSNFVARITEDVTVDDGAEVRRSFTIQGHLGHRALPEVRVPIPTFASMLWVTEQWGVEARVLPGQGRKDYLRDAMQVHSTGARRRTIAGHLGWRRGPNGPTYLHAGGAIGDADIEVEVAQDGLTRYELPPAGGDVRGAMETSLAFLDVAERRVAYPSYSLMWRAPACAFLPFVVVPHFVGQTGALKSSLLAAQLAHYGTFRTKEDLPARWEFTENILEKYLFLTKDVPGPIDDLNPESVRRRKEDLEKTFSRLVGNVRNATGRRRMTRELGTRLEYRPRGLPISTGEYTPTLASSRMAGLFPIPFEKTSVHRARLDALQGRLGVLRHAMRGFIEDIRADFDGLAGRVPERFEQLREAAADLGQLHTRLPENVAHIHLGLELGIGFALKVGALDEATAARHLDVGWQTLLELATEHGRMIGEERPTRAYLEALSEALAAGQAWLASPADGTAAAGTAGPGSKKLGWQDDKGIYLLPGIAFAFATDRLTYRGGIHVNERALLHALEGEGLLVRDPSEPNRLIVNKWAEGGTKRVLHLKPGALADVPPAEPTGAEVQTRSCWQCRADVRSDRDARCPKCRWLICECGACGCRKT